MGEEFTEQEAPMVEIEGGLSKGFLAGSSIFLTVRAGGIYDRKVGEILKWHIKGQVFGEAKVESFERHEINGVKVTILKIAKISEQGGLSCKFDDEFYKLMHQ